MSYCKEYVPLIRLKPQYFEVFPKLMSIQINIPA